MDSLREVKNGEDLGRLIDTQFFAMVLSCPLEFLAVLDAAPEEWLVSNPRYRLAKSLASTMGNPITFDGYAQAALAQENSASSEPASRDVLGVLYGRLTHQLTTGKFDAAGALAHEIYATIEEAEDTRGFEDIVPILLFRVGVTRLLQGDLRAAIAALWDARRWAQIDGIHPMDVYLGDTLALCFALQGDIVRAQKCLSDDAGNRRAPVGTLGSRLEHSGILAIAVVALAELNQSAATSALSKLGSEMDAGEFWWIVEHLQARFALYWGDPTAAMDRLGHKLSQQRVLAPPPSFAGTILRCDLSDLHQATGSLANAERPLQAVGLNTCNPHVVVSTARLDILRGNSDLALLAIDSFLAGIPSFPGVTPEVSALRAIALFNLSDASAASAELSRCLNILVLRGASEALAEIPQQLLALSKLAVAPDRDLPQCAFSHRTLESQSKLSKRELDVLAVLVLHTSTSAMANALFISVNTAKYHLRNLYSKLNAKSRDQALRRATELGLIP